MKRRPPIAAGQIWRPRRGPERRVVAVFTAAPASFAIFRRPHVFDRVLYSVGYAARSRECCAETFARWIASSRARRAGNRRRPVLRLRRPRP